MFRACFGGVKRCIPTAIRMCGRAIKSNVVKVSGGTILGTTATYATNRTLPVIEDVAKKAILDTPLPVPLPSFWMDRNVRITIIVIGIMALIIGIATHLLGNRDQD